LITFTHILLFYDDYSFVPTDLHVFVIIVVVSPSTGLLLAGGLLVNLFPSGDHQGTAASVAWARRASNRLSSNSGLSVRNIGSLDYVMSGLGTPNSTRSGTAFGNGTPWFARTDGTFRDNGNGFRLGLRAARAGWATRRGNDPRTASTVTTAFRLRSGREDLRLGGSDLGDFWLILRSGIVRAVVFSRVGVIDLLIIGGVILHWLFFRLLRGNTTIVAMGLRDISITADSIVAAQAGNGGIKGTTKVTQRGDDILFSVTVGSWIAPNGVKLVIEGGELLKEGAKTSSITTGTIATDIGALNKVESRVTMTNVSLDHEKGSLGLLQEDHIVVTVPLRDGSIEGVQVWNGSVEGVVSPAEEIANLATIPSLSGSGLRNFAVSSSETNEDGTQGNEVKTHRG